MTQQENILHVNGREVRIENERNLLEVVRKANINIPTFCYHSELSVYGACRLCLTDVEGRGIVAACSTKPEPGMRIKTHTREIRDIRKISLELLLANHDSDCSTCVKSESCKLRSIASELGVENVRFKKTEKQIPLDFSSDALVRDPNKCILCGDCVRACDEIQDIGAISFTNRGAGVQVEPSFGKNLADVECVDCGQCARVCPTGAITPKPKIEQVWDALDNPEKVVVAQIAPAVRVAIGEMFGFEPGTIQTGQTVSALRTLGFDKVYDTSFAADLTVIEEANEFLQRKAEGGKLPLITSCCPSWVKYAEQFYPEMISSLSSCKSPQQMFGSLAKERLPEMLGVKKENIVVVSIMPCTAKKSEAARPEFNHDSIREVDHVLTTQELGAMVKRAGIAFRDLEPSSVDLPFGFKSGAGVIFGATGGVSEAVLRYVNAEVNHDTTGPVEFKEVRGDEHLREASIELNGETVTMAIVHGLANARKLLEEIKAGKKQVDFIEVMSCPGGCVGGAGQPVTFDAETRKRRTKGIYQADKMLQVHRSQENPYLASIYKEFLGEPGGKTAHELLHTHYKNRKRMNAEKITLIGAEQNTKVNIEVCLGTSCFVKDSQSLIQQLIERVESEGLADRVSVRATFCMEKCEEGPNVTVNGYHISESSLDVVWDLVQTRLQQKDKVRTITVE